MASIGNKEKNGGIGLFWTLFVVGIYMVIGPALILLNKFILHNLNFQYPMFLSGLGVLVAGIVARLLVGCGYVTLQRKDAVEGLLWYRRVLPVGLAHAGTLAFGNSVYLLLNVGFIQMLKSFTPVIIMLTAYLARIETPTRPVVSSVLVISLGTAMTCSFTPQVEDRTGQNRTGHDRTRPFTHLSYTLAPLPRYLHPPDTTAVVVGFVCHVTGIILFNHTPLSDADSFSSLYVNSFSSSTSSSSSSSAVVGGFVRHVPG